MTAMAVVNFSEVDGARAAEKRARKTRRADLYHRLIAGSIQAPFGRIHPQNASSTLLQGNIRESP